jgi:hypothetical protein
MDHTLYVLELLLETGHVTILEVKFNLEYKFKVIVESASFPEKA